jgi:hypothetical protein
MKARPSRDEVEAVKAEGAASPGWLRSRFSGRGRAPVWRPAADRLAQSDNPAAKHWNANSTQRNKFTMSTRRALPNRRRSESFSFECGGLRYTCTVGYFPSGEIGEIFLGNHKSNSAADTNARDCAIVFSLAIQHGVDPATVRRALTRNSDGSASGPLGRALDLLTQQEDVS